MGICERIRKEKARSSTCVRANAKTEKTWRMYLFLSVNLKNSFLSGKTQLRMLRTICQRRAWGPLHSSMRGGPVCSRPQLQNRWEWGSASDQKCMQISILDGRLKAGWLEGWGGDGQLLECGGSGGLGVVLCNHTWYATVYHNNSE